MLTIGIVDDGVGALPTLNKLKQVVSAHYICLIDSANFPLGNKQGKQLLTVGNKAVSQLIGRGCDAIVLSSVALSSRCLRPFLQKFGDVSIFGCDAPVVHASTYTASRVLVVGDCYAVNSLAMSSVIPVAMSDFPILAEAGDERAIVNYVSDKCEVYYGQFDCIALANSSMNMYKNCFSRVFPNVQIFDSLEGVARRLRKKYRKFDKVDTFVEVIDPEGNDLTQKYSFFLE